MRLTKSIVVFIAMLLLSLGAVAYATPKPADGSAKDDDSDDDLNLVPLVNTDAPLVVVWTSENDDVPISDVTAIDSQLFEDMKSRRDIRLISREKTLRLVDQSSDKRLMHCKWEDPCLVGIGKVAKADIVIGVKLTGTKEQYFLAFKLFRLGDKPGKVMKFSSGPLSALLVGGISKAVESIVKAEPKPIKKLPDLPPKKAAAPQAVKIHEHVAVKPSTKVSKDETKAPGAIQALPQATKVQVVPPKPVDEVAKRIEPPGFFTRHLGSVIATGLGLALAGAGIGFGTKARDYQDRVEFQWDPSLDDSGRSDALAANILFGLSGVSIVVAVVLFVLEPSAEDYAISAKSDGTVALFRF